MSLNCVWADCSVLMSDCPPQHVNAPSYGEWYLGRQADGVPVRRRKLQLPSEDLIEQLLLHIVLTAERKTRGKERTTCLSTPLKTPDIKYKTKLSSPLTFWREGIHTAGCRWSLPPPRYPPSDHTYTHTHTHTHSSVSVHLSWPSSSSPSRLLSHPVSAMISGATYVGVPHTVYSGPSTTVARPKSPSFRDLVPSGYSHTCRTHGQTPHTQAVFSLHDTTQLDALLYSTASVW